MDVIMEMVMSLVMDMKPATDKIISCVAANHEDKMGNLRLRFQSPLYVLIKKIARTIVP
jgi:hypothetical protein